MLREIGARFHIPNPFRHVLTPGEVAISEHIARRTPELPPHSFFENYRKTARLRCILDRFYFGPNREPAILEESFIVKYDPETGQVVEKVEGIYVISAKDWD